jgi:tetratricopeptide (TPR) repeat protein
MSVALDHLGIISAFELGNWTSVANRVASLAATAADLGDRDEAERRYGLAIRLARTLEAPHFLCEWLHGLAELLASAGRAAEAEERNTEALTIAARHAEREVELRARLLALRLEVELGRRQGPGAAPAPGVGRGHRPPPRRRRPPQPSGVGVAPWRSWAAIWSTNQRRRAFTCGDGSGVSRMPVRQSSSACSSSTR